MPAARTHRLKLSDLPHNDTATFELAPEAEARALLADELGITAIRKLRFTGRIIPEGRRDWRLEGELGATVVQPCVVTLEPVTTRIDEKVMRRYLADLPPPPPGETESPDDDSIEELPETLDLAEVMAESLALALPLFPRAADAAPGDAEALPPGAAPIDSTENRPFEALKGLRDSLKDAEED